MTRRVPFVVAPAASPLPRWRWVAPVFVGALLTVAVGVAPASAAEELPARTSEVLLCDPTACYVAWRVVDSDHDGVSDADEIMAGTDPYDPASRPRLVHIAELGFDRRLPSFEAGLGAFVVLPVEIAKIRAAASVDLLGAFPGMARADSLARLGISMDTLGQYGIDPNRDGFSIGLDTAGTKDSPARVRVGGIDAALISDGLDPPMASGVEHGGVVRTGYNQFGDFVVVYADGSYSLSNRDGDGALVVDFYNAGGQLQTSSVITVSEGMDGDVRVHTVTVSTSDAHGNRMSHSTTTSHTRPNHSMTRLTTTTTYNRDPKGNVTGTVVTTREDYVSATGDHGESNQGAQSCDENGKNCEPALPHDDESDHDGDGHDGDESDHDGYYDADATPAFVTQEVVDGVLRLRGAAVNVVRNWTAPGLEEAPEDPRNPSAVALIDSDLASQFLLIEPMRITKAQPETRDDLPRPGEAAPRPDTGCQGLC